MLYADKSFCVLKRNDQTVRACRMAKKESRKLLSIYRRYIVKYKYVKSINVCE